VGRLAEFLAQSGLSADKRSAFLTVFSRWGASYPADFKGLACNAAKREGLRCLSRKGTWEAVRAFDLPAVLELSRGGGAIRYAAVTAIDESQVSLRFNERVITLPLSEVSPWWNGVFILLWRPPVGGATSIAENASGEDVIWLRQQLGRLDGTDGSGPEVFDEDLKTRVKSFQRERRLADTGIVGEETLTLLTTSVMEPRMPRLSAGVP
jgi:general secretion pathway protein A